jgi:hypothetical protein
MPVLHSSSTRMTGPLLRPEIGVAGARLLYPSGSFQDGGIVIGIGDRMRFKARQPPVFRVKLRLTLPCRRGAECTVSPLLPAVA